jgi:hypothetical protein
MYVGMPSYFLYLTQLECKAIYRAKFLALVLHAHADTQDRL